MSQLPPQAVDEFQALWKKHFGEDLPREEPAARAHQTFTVLRMLIEPLSESVTPLPSSALQSQAQPTVPSHPPSE